VAKGFIDNSFAEGWQKKTAHDSIREQGNDARKAAQLTEKANVSSQQAEAVRGKATDVVKTQLSTPVGPGKDIAQAHQRIRPEVQDQAARHTEQAAHEFQKVRADAGRLSNLQKTKGVDKAFDVITQKPQVAESGYAPKQGTQQQSAHIALQAAQAGKADSVSKKGSLQNVSQSKAPKAKGSHKAEASEGRKTADAQKTSKTPEQTSQSENATNSAALAGVSGQKAVSDVDGKDKRDSDVEKEEGLEEHRGRDASAFSKGSKVGSTRRELGGLLGGFAGGSDSDNLENEGKSAVSAGAVADANKKELPENDPSFHVYSEFDETKPGIEQVISKARIFDRMVAQRLDAIAQFDCELEGRIKDMFKTAPLSERIIGDLAGELSTADFLKSIYGGLIG
jgi:hypothetical protein